MPPGPPPSGGGIKKAAISAYNVAVLSGKWTKHGLGRLLGEDWMRWHINSPGKLIKAYTSALESNPIPFSEAFPELAEEA